MSTWASALLSAAAILQAGAPAATATPPSDSTTVQSVVITAPSQAEKDKITAFVSTVASSTGDKRLARWDRKICPGVIGMQQAYAQVLIEHMAIAALRIGLETGAPGCKPNVLIIGSEDGRALARKSVAERPGAFAKYDTELSAGTKALEAFENSEAPVRWWHVSMRVTADGIRYVPGQHIQVRGVSHIRGNSRDDFDHVIVILDLKHAGVLRFGALADYVAMVSLAQIDPDAKTAGVSTILNLFADRDAGLTPAEGLTDWDVAYLKGLYGARRDASRRDQQEADVVRSMSGDLLTPADTPKSQ